MPLRVTFAGRIVRLVVPVLAVVVAAFAVGGCTHLAAADPDALWKIVGGQCAPGMTRTGNPSPCTAVDLDHRYAILKDIRGGTQYLLIPTDRTGGIEDPAILYGGSPEYWSYAWDARRYVIAKAKVPLAADQLGLEINAVGRRSQDQLHIHIDCMRADVTAALAPYRGDAPGRWRDASLDGKRYRVMRVTSLVDRSNPFRVVARTPDGQQAMGSETILVTGAGADAARDGWLIVNSSANLAGGTGTAEGLLDHACAIAH